MRMMCYWSMDNDGQSCKLSVFYFYEATHPRKFAYPKLKKKKKILIVQINIFTCARDTEFETWDMDELLRL